MSDDVDKLCNVLRKATLHARTRKHGEWSDEWEESYVQFIHNKCGYGYDLAFSEHCERDWVDKQIERQKSEHYCPRKVEVK